MKLRNPLTASSVVLLAIALSVVVRAEAVVAASRSCATFEFIGVAGSGELEDGTLARKSLWMGNTVKGLYNKVLARYKGSKTSFTSYGVRYAAIPVDLDPTHVDVYLRGYAQSVQQGVTNLRAEMLAAAAACPEQQFILAGYSQGADVAKRTFDAVDLELQGRVRAMLLFGDPRFNPANTTEAVGNPQVGTQDGLITVLTGNAAPVDPPDVQQRTRSYCDARDIICQAPWNQVTGDLPHYHYGDWATQRATDFLASIEPPAMCAVSTASWSSTTGLISNPDRGVTITNPEWGQARANPGYRFVGFVAVADTYVYDPATDSYVVRQVRLDQPSYELANPDHPEQNVISAGRVYYMLARAVSARCGVPGSLTFSVPVAESRHMVLEGTFTSAGRPVSGVALVWYYGSTDGMNPGGIDSANVTDASGFWRAEYLGPVKPVISPGTYLMALVYPGDVNRLPVTSSTLSITVV